MIVVANTKELEEKYNLNNLKDEELVMIEGGLKGKNKYNAAHYKTRTTYTVRTIKKIIQQMELIEKEIPKEWDEFQRAKYIYTVLGNYIEYEHDREKYNGGKCSNLTGLITGKAICAGYSLIFKEMMDRQGIECDYVRGRSKNDRHAWNVLTLQGKSYPVDLTWDSSRVHKGKKELEFFGTYKDFFKVHTPDKDERIYKYSRLEKDEVNAINISRHSKNEEKTSEQKKKNVISYAIEKTYFKFEKMKGTEDAINQMKVNIKRYITENDITVFTRNGMARDEIIKNVSVEDMIRIISESYVKKSMQNGKKNILENAIEVTARKYGLLNAQKALEKYIKTGHIKGFTRDENARENIEKRINNEMALEMIISDFVNGQIRQIQLAKRNDEMIENEAKEYFNANEFIAVNFPENKKSGIIKRAIVWIKEKNSKIIKSKENTKANKEKENNVR